MGDCTDIYRYSNVTEMRNHRNSALAIVEAGTFVGASFIIAACTHAENVALAWTFFALGMIALVLYSVAYELMTKYDDRAAINAHNVAAGRCYTSIKELCVVCLSIHR